MANHPNAVQRNDNGDPVAVAVQGANLVKAVRTVGGLAELAKEFDIC